MKITLEELGWLAGLLDGEACFCAKLANLKRLQSNPTGNLSVIITVQSASVRMIDELQRLFDLMEIRYVRPKVHRHKRSRKLIYRIDVCRKADVQRLLKIVVPHLRVKDKEADEIIAFFDAFPDRYDRTSTPQDRVRLVTVVRDLKKVA